MSRHSRFAYRALARLLPRWFRAQAAPDLEATAAACLAREHARRGRLGLVWAWFRLVADTVSTSVALRWTPTSPGMAPPGRASLVRLEVFVTQPAQELRQAWRALRRQPGFAAVTILTVALGVGANTAVFSVVSGVLLRPLPYPEPDRLHRITTMFPDQFDSPFPISLPEFIDFRDDTRAYGAVGAYYVSNVTVGADTPERAARALVSREVLTALQVPPALGRPFHGEDSRPGAPDVTILTWPIWQRLYGGDPGVIGQHIRINDIPNQIVGVMPNGFDLLDEGVGLLQPLTIDPADFPSSRTSHYLYLVGRLAGGVTAAQGRDDIARLEHEWSAAAEEHHVLGARQHPLHVEPFGAQLIADATQPLLLIQVAVLLILIVACVNLTNLFLVRADARLGEYAVQTALGASGARLFRQLLAEGLLLAAAGSLAGLALAQGSVTSLLAINPDVVPRAGGVGLDGPVLMFAAALATLAGLVMALVPYVRLRSRPLTTLMASGGSRSVAHGTGRWRSALVIGEVALAVFLVTGAGLLLRTVWNLTHVDAGFSRDQLTTFSVVLPSATYDPPARQRFYDDLTGRLRALGGVDAVASMTGLPPLRRMNVNDTDFEHIPNDRPRGVPPIENVDYYQTISVGYVETMGIDVVRGRAFRPSDLNGAPVALVNDALVRKFFPDGDPIGGRVKPPFLGGDTRPWLTIVGVLADVKQGGLSADVGTELYLLDGQVAQLAGESAGQRYLVVRSARPASALAPEIRQVVRDLDAGLPVLGIRSMDAVVDASITEPRFLTLLLTTFAIVALTLAAVGTYGVLSYFVVQRRREFGIRLALGDNRGGVLRLVLRSGVILLGSGLVIGLLASILSADLASAMLFDVTGTDPVTLVGVSGVILAVGLLACLIPAWRATRVDPLIVLRDA